MSSDDFVSNENVRSQIVYHKVNTNKEKVDWLSIRWLQIREENPFEIRYQYSHNTLEAWKTLDVRNKRPGRPAGLGRVELVPLYTGPRPLNESKLKDLKELMQFVPPVYHEFYSSLESATAEQPSSDGEDD